MYFDSTSVRLIIKLNSSMDPLNVVPESSSTKLLNLYEIISNPINKPYITNHNLPKFEDYTSYSSPMPSL